MVRCECYPPTRVYYTNANKLDNDIHLSSDYISPSSSSIMPDKKQETSLEGGLLLFSYHEVHLLPCTHTRIIADFIILSTA